MLGLVKNSTQPTDRLDSIVDALAYRVGRQEMRI